MPPATSTLPFDSSVAVWPVRGMLIAAAGTNVSVAGSYSSQVACGSLVCCTPPVISHWPFGKRVQVCSERGVDIVGPGENVSVARS